MAADNAPMNRGNRPPPSKQVTMMTNRPLPPNVRKGDPGTSHAAAAPERVPLRKLVEAVHRRHPDGLTDWELTTLLSLPERRKPTVAKRRQELGAVDTGVRRHSPDGMACIVWALPTGAYTRFQAAAQGLADEAPAIAEFVVHTDDHFHG